ncbi:MAG: hypothetical protein ABI907_05430 [Ramlibacter sp.]
MSTTSRPGVRAVVLRPPHLAWLALLLALPSHSQGAPASAASEAYGLSVEGVSGEILDTAIEHCRRGERAQAFSMFAAIREQLDPPPALLRLVQDLEATGCVLQVASSAKGLKLQIGAGYDTNVTQGISARTLTLGSGGQALELELDDSYRPRASPFAQAALEYTLPVPALGGALQLGAAQRSNFSASSLNVSTGSLSYIRSFEVLGKAARVQADWSELWLGGRHYQRTTGASLQWVPSSGPAGAWVASMSALQVDYLTQSAQNAVQYEAGLNREQRINASTAVYGGVSLTGDRAQGGRPGGDRSGYQAQAGMIFAVEGWRLRPQVSYQRWASREVFAAGLIDTPRRNHTTQLAFVAERPLGANQTLVLEWRARDSRDNIALYQYRSQTLLATFQYRF